jgi:hypothetical protein
MTFTRYKVKVVKRFWVTAAYEEDVEEQAVREEDQHPFDELEILQTEPAEPEHDD